MPLKTSDTRNVKTRQIKFINYRDIILLTLSKTFVLIRSFCFVHFVLSHRKLLNHIFIIMYRKNGLVEISKNLAKYRSENNLVEQNNYVERSS